MIEIVIGYVKVIQDWKRVVYNVFYKFVNLCCKILLQKIIPKSSFHFKTNQQHSFYTQAGKYVQTIAILNVLKRLKRSIRWDAIIKYAISN